jgi:hypothetical protein
MQSLAIYLYVMAVGFVAAGMLASFVQLVLGEPMRFGMEPNSILASIGAVLLRVLAGPAILMRNAWRGLKLRPARRSGSAFPRPLRPSGACSQGVAARSDLEALARCQPQKRAGLLGGRLE